MLSTNKRKNTENSKRVKEYYKKNLSPDTKLYYKTF